MIKTLYMGYGGVVLLGLLVAQYQGWSLANINEVEKRAQVGARQSRLVSFRL